MLHPPIQYDQHNTPQWTNYSMYLFVWQHRWNYYGVLWYFTARESRPVPSGIVVCGRGGRVRRLRRRLFALLRCHPFCVRRLVDDHLVLPACRRVRGSDGDDGGVGPLCTSTSGNAVPCVIVPDHSDGKKHFLVLSFCGLLFVVDEQDVLVRI